MRSIYADIHALLGVASHLCRYFKAGNPSGQPVVLVHGFGVGAWHYENNLESLAESGYCVYAVDLLGQGKTTPHARTLGGINPRLLRTSKNTVGHANRRGTAYMAA